MQLPNWINTDTTIYEYINDKLCSCLWGLRLLNLEHHWGKYDLSNVRIAVIDSGIDTQHEDFDDTICQGYNFVENNKDVRDKSGHGTGVIGIIAAVANNQLGIAGAAYGAKIIPLKVIDDKQYVNIHRIIKALDWCILNNIDIINISMGIDCCYWRYGDFFNKNCLRKIELCINKAIENNIIIISSLGNKSRRGMDFPANISKVIGVGAYGINELSGEIYIPNFNNKGNEATIYAPGENILTTLPNNQYGYLSGTSLAAAYVTAANVYAKAVYPDLKPEFAKKIMLETSGIFLNKDKKYKFLNVDAYLNKIEEIVNG